MKSTGEMRKPMEKKEQIAVITGGASGIGLGVAKVCIQRNMKVIIADIEQEALDNAVEILKESGGEAEGILTDVSQPKQVKRLSEQVFQWHENVHFLMLNAGVNVRKPLWEHTIRDWNWIIGVNLMGVIHGIRYFVPKMIKQEVESYLVTTASIMGLMMGMDAYSMTKHAVVALTEALHGQVRNRTKKLKISVFCPDFVQSKILYADRNRPKELQNEEEYKSPKVLANLETMRKMNAMGMEPEEAAKLLFKGMENGDFYILTNKKSRTRKNIEIRVKRILEAFKS